MLSGAIKDTPKGAVERHFASILFLSRIELFRQMGME